MPRERIHSITLRVKLQEQFDGNFNENVFLFLRTFSFFLNSEKTNRVINKLHIMLLQFAHVVKTKIYNYFADFDISVSQKWQ